MNVEPAPQPEIAEGTPPRRDLADDFAALSLAVAQGGSPPSHAFGRSTTTGIDSPGSAAADDAALDALLATLGLQAHAAEFRAHAVVNADEVRALTEEEMVAIVPGMSGPERLRLLRWAHDAENAS